MVTQLKSYLLQSTELQTMLEPQHHYAQDKLGKCPFHYQIMKMKIDLSDPFNRSALQKSQVV